MGSLNLAMVIGNLGHDAELRFTKGGTPVSTFSVATTDKWTDKEGNKQESTEWHRIVLWGKMAESLNEYLTKGKQIYAAGPLQTREWEDKEGVTRKTTEIRANRIVLLGGGGGERNSGEGGGSRRRSKHVSDEEMPGSGTGAATGDGFPEQPEDDIPF